MKKSILYTKTGDTGTTSLIGGKRIAKNSLRVNTYGTVDELNAWIGLLQSAARHSASTTSDQLNSDCSQLPTLISINNTLFNIGAYLATPSFPTSAPAKSASATTSLHPSSDGSTDQPETQLPSPDQSSGQLPSTLQALPRRLSELEHQIDLLDSLVPEQRTFILPGGSIEAAQAHIARTVCRRAEREILNLADSGEYVAPIVLTYINRLSDYLFILARYFNHTANIPDIPWQQ